MKIKECTLTDCELLADMNKCLIEDEGAATSTDADFLKNRMQGFLTNGYRAFIFSNDDKAAGYALVDESKSPVYLRQFYIRREARRAGNGRAAFHLLLDTIRADEIDIDVYVWNERGAAFWQAMGFKPRYIGMRMSR